MPGPQPDVDGYLGTSLRGRWSAASTWVVGAVAMCYFPSLGPTLGLGTADSFRFAALSDGWWLLSLLAIAATRRRIAAHQVARRRSGIGGLRAAVAVQSACVLIAWAVVLVPAHLWGLESAWWALAAWLPAAFLVVGCTSALVQTERSFAAEQHEADARLLALGVEIQALDQAHAHIVEEARAATTTLTEAVRAAMRIAHDEGMTSLRLRSILDDELREQARAASHRVHALQVESQPVALLRRRTIGVWLDSIAHQAWQPMVLGILLAAAATTPGVLITQPQPRGTWIALGSLAGALTAAGAARALSRWRRPRGTSARAWLLSAIALSAAILVAPAQFMSGGASLRDSFISVVLTLPALTLIMLLPLALAATRSTGATGRAERAGQLALATARRNSAAANVESARGSVVSALHTHVQSRALAAVTAIEMADEGFSGTEGIVEAVLEELASLSISTETHLPPREIEPIAGVLASWEPLLRLRVTVGDGLTSREQFVLAEHLQDLLVNAVKHGRARQAWIQIRADGERATLLEVIDDGIGPASHVVPGLGLRRVVGAEGSWSIMRQGGRTHVQVMLPRDRGKRTPVS